MHHIPTLDTSSITDTIGPPSPESLGLTSRRVTLPTGVTLHYVEKGDPRGEALIFLHGVSDSWRTWELVLPLISDAYHTYAISQRGHGDSAKPDTGYTLPNLGDDVRDFMGALGIAQATLIGHSMGSYVAHQVAVDHPTRVRRLVLVGGGPSLATNAAVIDFNMFVQAMEDPIDPVFVRDFQASCVFNPIPASYLDTVVAESLKVPAAVWKQAFAGFLEEDHDDRLGTIEAKTLILWGDRDEYFPLEGQQALNEAIPHSTLIVYPATGHSLHWEWPQRFVDDLHAFLA